MCGGGGWGVGRSFYRKGEGRGGGGGGGKQLGRLKGAANETASKWRPPPGVTARSRTVNKAASYGKHGYR